MVLPKQLIQHFGRKGEREGFPRAVGTTVRPQVVLRALRPVFCRREGAACVRTCVIVFFVICVTSVFIRFATSHKAF